MGEKKHARLLAAPILLGLSVCLPGCKSEPEPPLPPLSEKLLVALAADPVAVAEGKQLFVTACASCHGAEGQGTIGPNLTDEVWIHGGGPLELHTSISKGFPDKGMTPFENLLGPKRVRSLTAFVLTLKGRNLPGRPPEGPR